METFAPAYFDYMSAAVSANVCLAQFKSSAHPHSSSSLQRPTLLAKVFGCYKIIFRKNGNHKGPGRAKSMQMNLLVMENLFYDRRFSKVYLTAVLSEKLTY